MQKFNFVPHVLYNFLIFVTSELFGAKTERSRFQIIYIYIYIYIYIGWVQITPSVILSNITSLNIF